MKSINEIVLSKVFKRFKGLKSKSLYDKIQSLGGGDLLESDSINNRITHFFFNNGPSEAKQLKQHTNTHIYENAIPNHFLPGWRIEESQSFS